MENFKEVFKSKEEAKSLEDLDKKITELLHKNIDTSIKKYGSHARGMYIKIKTVEELTELSKEIIKDMQCAGDYYNFLEELSDVCIILTQLVKYYAIDLSFIKKACDIKLDETFRKYYEENEWY